LRAWAAALLSWADGEPADVPSARFMRPYLLALAAERASDARRALDLIDEALILSGESGERFADAQLLLIRGERQVEMGERDSATVTWSRAAAIAASQGAATLEERAVQRRMAIGGT
jgi:hypothetical protein